MSDARHLAMVELLGALTYGQLRAFEVAARALRHAPDARTADTLADFAVSEHEGYVLLREQLLRHTDLAAGVMDRQKPHFDAYFDQVPVDDWFGACVFFAVGLPLAADFSREIAPMLDEDTAGAVVGALGDRQAFEEFARGQIQGQLGSADVRERARHIVGDLLGRALTAFQGVVTDTDALKVLLSLQDGDDQTGESRVKGLAINVLGAHRRRTVALGIDELE